MSFNIIEHIVPGQHIRQSVEEDYAVLLSVKQYIPIGNPSPSPGDITIIGGHSSAFGKELYEPLWDDLEFLLSKGGRRIRSIWITDFSNQGASGLLNEETKFEDVSWYDHSRDLLHIINHFRKEMVQPIVGIGHSMGGNQHIMLSLAHPTLFTTMVLIDPIVAPASMVQLGKMLAKNSLRRRVEWPSRQEAEKSLNASFKFWDHRVREKIIKYGLFPFPKEGVESSEDVPTRLVTGRYQELVAFVRPSFIYSGKVKMDNIPWVQEALMVHKVIDFVPCNTLYISGGKSPATDPEIRKDCLKRTGSGAHMGRRDRKRRVEEAVVPGMGHFVALEAPKACAEAAAVWIDEEVDRWEKEEESMKKGWRNLSLEEKEERGNTWLAALKAKL